MSVDAWEIARLLLVMGVMGGLVLWVQRHPPQMRITAQARAGGGANERQTIEELTATVNTLGRQLDEANKRIRAVEEENAGFKLRIAELETQVALANKPLPLPAIPLEVIAGGDRALFERDRAALRRAGVAFRRVMDATQATLRAELRRRRQDGTLPPWWLISAHAGPQGVLLKDGLAGPAFWHEIFDGVRLVVLAACEGNTTADELAGLVETVVWFQEAVENQDAADFVYAFFRRLVNGLDVDRAFAEATRECPQVCEFVDLRHS